MVTAEGTTCYVLSIGSLTFQNQPCRTGTISFDEGKFLVGITFDISNPSAAFVELTRLSGGTF